MKQLVRTAFRHFGVEITRVAPSPSHLERKYVQGGRVPWSAGYGHARERFIREVLANARLLELFTAHDNLPQKFGVGFDERCVEYSWLLAHLQSDHPEIVLDAGSVLNHSFILEQPPFEKKRLHIMTLAPEDNCFWKKGISYLFQDLRNIPIRDAYYDSIVCLSTVEHIGCDNTAYTHNEVDREQSPKDFIRAMQELARVLKPGGRLFLTVPFGSYRHFGSFQQFDMQLLADAVAAFGKTATLSQSFYRYTEDGWNAATGRDCANSEYVEWVAQVMSGADWPEPLRCEPDLAAAARAVACVALTKG